MPQPTDLFCHTILFAKFNMLTSYSLHFLTILREHVLPLDFAVDQWHYISLTIKYRGTFFLNLFMVDEG